MNLNAQPDPEHVVLAGDWHGNLLWVHNYVIPEAAALFEKLGETRRIIIQLGDFGFVPTADDGHLTAISALLSQHGMELWWIDGNHEHWPAIRVLVNSAGTAGQLPYPVPIPLPSFPAISYLPRGTRWRWGEHRWLAVGGAVSVDKLLRTEGENWFADEEITEEQAELIVAAGQADVLLSHDVPDCWFPRSLPQPAREWAPMLPHAREHSRRLERIALACGVTRVFHGHYHHYRNDRYDAARVIGLLSDGYGYNLMPVNVRTMEAVL